MNTTPIIDIFAGPGGLAEGFSSLKVGTSRPFRVALSIEKDEQAHRTLSLRAFYRQFPDGPPPEYWSHLRGELSRQDLLSLPRYRDQAQRAEEEAVRLELGPETAEKTRTLVKKALKGHSGPWGLIGGPPCQAYSLVGRSRNRGVAGYVPEEDHRQTLYVEYLQILADHRPTFFVMENVKGMLSATLASERIFDRIRSDLEDPATALKREGRKAPAKGPRYTILSLCSPQSGLFGLEPQDFVVRAEDYGIPQARHRVILLGVLEGVDTRRLGRLQRRKPRSLEATLKGMPELRSGITDLDDDDKTWTEFLQGLGRSRWVRDADAKVRDRIRECADMIQPLSAGRGGEFICGRRSQKNPLGGVINHSSRAHIAADLERYFFAACFADVHERSPVLSEFPEPLLPQHRNAARAVAGSHFNDRFRVQLFGRPSTTITSHISKDGHYYVHPDPLQCRSLTVREAARLQTFPDDYLFCGPRTSQYHQVGNAVPPELARQIAEVVTALV